LYFHIKLLAVRSTLTILLLLAAISTSCGDKPLEYKDFTGPIFGTFFNITYEYFENKDLDQNIIELMDEFDRSLSTYNPESVISRINANDTGVRPDAYFRTVFNRAQQISMRTKGAFDITVAPLVNAYGFGFTKRDSLVSDERIEELLGITGYTKVHVKGDEVIKENPRLMLDVSAIAKGYAVDVVSMFLEDEGVENYLVEIGGEIRCRGLNRKGNKWRVGVDKPIEKMLDRQIQVILNLTDISMATSGNYRQFYEENDIKYSHTIDPETGKPVYHNLLSATVLAPDCMTADAFATAFMVMGLEKAMEYVNSDPELEGYFIFDKDEIFHSTYSEGLESIIEDVY